MNDTFKTKVLQIVREIERGKVMSYAEVAEAAGRPRASRAVGTIMKSNYDPTVPCHRVVRSDGAVGEYNRGGHDAKIRILISEGVQIVGERVLR